MGAPDRRHRPTRRAALSIAVALAGVTAVGCASSEWRLARLESDPMASYVVPDAVDTLTTRFAGGTSGVSSPSMVRVGFTVAAGRATAAIEQIANAAADAGWELTPREPNGFTGHKQLDGMKAQILIAGIVQDDTVWFELSSRAG